MTPSRTSLDTPIGTLVLFAEGDALVEIRLPGKGDPGATTSTAVPSLPPVLVAARAQLAEYFAGARRAFDLRLDPRGTAFQRAVWRALLSIPYGVTRSYVQIAGAVGKPSASRAVGAANGQNPLAIVVPCHRVIGADGSLTGYGGGLAQKEWLLRHEGAMT
jgi:methylated-DNA-[protein]-cysteine S-methyltransferase